MQAPEAGEKSCVRANKDGEARLTYLSLACVMPAHTVIQLSRTLYGNGMITLA